MECNVIKDLIPLYIDDCCSKESAAIVKEHIDCCSQCKALYENMKTPSNITHIETPPTKLNRINNWRASVFQSVLLFISFSIITTGVALEAATPSGFTNGYWAVSLVIPATGFMLSLANWYFVRLYKNRKSFSNCSSLTTLCITVLSYIWVGFHYRFNFSELLQGINFLDFIDILQGIIFFYGIGIALTVVFCVLSKLLSSKYAAMLGKE